jgi:polyferredoxin
MAMSPAADEMGAPASGLSPRTGGSPGFESPGFESPGTSALSRGLAALGEWLRCHQATIRRGQWLVVFIYLFLVIVPALLPLPDPAVHIWSDLTLFAQFAFWGIWWPFVLLSMILVGRTWCGLFCPEGTLAEVASSYGRGLSIPRWITWKGWPFTAFVCTTVFGQMLSVYQYPWPALLILGGSTLGAIAVGLLYGRNKRVWCRYLCPVNGVFGLLAKLAPVHFRVDHDAWARSRAKGNEGVHPIDCAPLVPIKTMQGAADCHMCGRCSGFRGAIRLAPRAPGTEIVEAADPSPSETWLIIFGLMGVAAGAFQWSSSPWFIALKQALAGWLIDHGQVWLLELQPPWWILTNYAERNDQMSLLDGAVLLLYIAATAILIGGFVSLCLAAATLRLGRWSSARFHRLAQSLVPIAGCGLFLGLSALTVTLLRAEGLSLAFVGMLRALLLAGAAAWSIGLAWRIAGREACDSLSRAGAVVLTSGAVSAGVTSSVFLFFIW